MACWSITAYRLIPSSHQSSSIVKLHRCIIHDRIFSVFISVTFQSVSAKHNSWCWATLTTIQCSILKHNYTALHPEKDRKQTPIVKLNFSHHVKKKISVNQKLHQLHAFHPFHAFNNRPCCAFFALAIPDLFTYNLQPCFKSNSLTCSADLTSKSKSGRWVENRHAWAIFERIASRLTWIFPNVQANQLSFGNTNLWEKLFSTLNFFGCFVCLCELRPLSIIIK